MDNVKIQKCFATLNKHTAIDHKLRLVYEWVKVGHINPAEFQFLMMDLALDLINKTASTR